MHIKDSLKCDCGYVMVPIGLSRRNQIVRLFCSQCGKCIDIPFEKTEKGMFGLQDNGHVSFNNGAGIITCDFSDLPDFYLSDFFDGNLEKITDGSEFNNAKKYMPAFAYIEENLTNDQQSAVLSHFDIPLFSSFSDSLLYDFKDAEEFGEGSDFEEYLDMVISYANETFDLNLDSDDALEKCGNLDI